MFLSAEASSELVRSVELFSLHYNWLCKDSRRNKKFLFNFTPKLHAGWHLASLSKYLSPAAGWCYAFEDFIGRIKKCGHASIAGTQMHRIPHKVFEHYSLILAEMFGIDVTKL